MQQPPEQTSSPSSPHPPAAPPTAGTGSPLPRLVGSGAKPSPGVQDARPDGPRTVLVADDEHLVAAGLAADLSELGFEPIGPAADGQEAIEMARDRRPDLVILDVSMPRLNGIEAARTITSELGVPVILCTAYASEEYAEAGTEAGVDAYLIKPVTKDQLRVNIKYVWQHHNRRLDDAGRIDKLEQRLEDRKTIEQAKWLLVDRKRVSEPEAMRLLQKQARNNRRTLVEVARTVIETSPLL